MVTHRAEPEGPTTRIYNYVVGELWGEEEAKKKKDWQQVLAQVPIFEKEFKKKIFRGGKAYLSVEKTDSIYKENTIF